MGFVGLGWGVVGKPSSQRITTGGSDCRDGRRRDGLERRGRRTRSVALIDGPAGALRPIVEQ